MLYPASVPSSTSYAAPFGLVFAGGSSPAKRPATKLAFITHALAVQGRIEGYIAYTWSARRQAWTKHPRRFERADVVTSWYKRPTGKQIRIAKGRLVPQGKQEDLHD